MNRCWFAARVVAIKRKYRLIVDAREARALEGILSRCASTAMVVAGGGREAVSASSSKAPSAGGPARCSAGTRTGTGASPAAKRARTASPRCGAIIRPTR